MPTVKPFRALRYNKEKVRDISRVIAPPYDVISKSLQDELYKKDPHNVVRLILNKSNNRYTRAKKFLDAWLAEDILKKDSGDSFYIWPISF